jgi:hypothetical protein
MSQQLLRRAWDALDTFKQAYPENWHEDDQQVLDDLIKADLDLSGVKREWVGLTDREMMDAIDLDDSPMAMGRKIEAKLKEKNNG